MKRIGVLVLIMIVGCGLFKGKKESTLSGVVLDKETNEIIQEATIEITDGEGYKTTSNETGQYSITIPYGEYMITTTANGYVSKAEKIKLEEKEVTHNIYLFPSKFSVVGVIVDAITNEPVHAMISLVGFDTDAPAPQMNDPVTGRYELKLLPGQYRITVEAPGYKKISKSIIISQDEERYLMDFEIIPVKKEVREVQTWTVYFEKGKSFIKSIYYPVLDKVSSHLLANPSSRVEIHGHTDSIGNEGKNYWLSVERSRSVANYLVAKGVQPNRIEIQGHGETAPVGDNKTIEGRKLNRRVDLIIK